MKPTVRRAVAQDISQLQVLKHDQLPAETLLAQNRQRLTEAEEGKAAYLVAEVQGQIIGQVFLKFYGKLSAPDYPDIEDLYVRPDFRRKGIATELMRHCENIAADKGFPAIGLAAGVDEHDPGRILYEELSYSKTETQSYVDGIYNGIEDWVIDLRKVLNP